MLTQSEPTAHRTPSAAPPTVMETVKSLRSQLTPVYGHGEAEAMIRLIFEHLKGWSPVDIIINEPRPLSEYMQSRIACIIGRLRNNEPIQYILGTAYFYGFNFKVAPGVLIPRPETEELVDMIVGAHKGPDLRILDICTGTGCIAIALARTLPFAHADAIDNSPEALKIAEENVRELKADVSIIDADIFHWEPERDAYDIVVANPPYIDASEMKDMAPNVVDYEPHSALFVPDSDPLVFYKRIAGVAYGALRAGGKIYLEINPLHAESLASLFLSKGFVDVAVSLDIHARKRFLSARKPSE